MIKAVIFDMDGVIIDSEPIWRQAEKEVFSTVNIALLEEDCKKTMGYKIDEVVDYWHQLFPWQSPSKAEIKDNIIDRVIELIQQKGAAMAGLEHAISLIKSHNLKLAIASSSANRIIEAVVAKLKLKDVFDICCSAENENWGKPHPAVFITTASRLNVNPEHCLVIEDSAHGVIAARAAKMKVLVVPEKDSAFKNEFHAAHYKLNSLKELAEDHLL